MKRKQTDEEKRKELEHLMEELKKTVPSDMLDEYNELENLLSDAVLEDKTPIWKRLFKGSISFMHHLSIMYIACLLCFGFFFSVITISYKPLLFLVGGIIAVVLTLFEQIPRNPLRQHFLIINFMIFALILIGLYVVNRDIYQVFQFSAVWVFYIIAVELLYYLCDTFLVKKLIR